MTLESSLKKQRTRSPSPAVAASVASSAGFEQTENGSADASTLVVAAGVSLAPSPPSFIVGLLRPNLLLIYALLSWWLVVIVHALLSPQLQVKSALWLNALVVSAVVGSALNANAWPSDRCSLRTHIARAPIACLRFFVIPFCVSSYSAIASQNPKGFCWMVPRNARLVAALIGAITLEVLALWTAGRWVRRRRHHLAATVSKQSRTVDVAVQADSSWLLPLPTPASSPLRFNFSSPCSSSARSVRRRSSSIRRFSPAAAASVAPPSLRVEPLATYLGSAITPKAQTQRAARTVGFVSTPRPLLLLDSCATPTPRFRSFTPQLFALLLESDAGRLHPHLLRCIAEYAEEMSSCRGPRRVRLSPSKSSFTFR